MTFRPALLCLCCLALSGAPSRAALVPDAIPGVTAKAYRQGDTADPNGNGGLNNVVNGNGLAVGNAADPATWIHDTQWQTGWQGTGTFTVDSNGAGSALTPGFWFVADLGAEYTRLRQMIIWNVRENGVANRGTRNVDLFYAVTPAVTPVTGGAYDFNSGGWTQFLTDHVVPQNLTSGADDAHDYIDLSGIPSARHIGIRINANYNSNFRVGFSEIQFTRAWVVDPPQIQHRPVAPLYATRAGVGVDVLSSGGEAPVVTVFHGATDGGTNAAAWASALVLPGTGSPRSGEITGLLPGETRFFRARAVNSGGTVWAAASGQFTTPSASAPSVGALAPASLTGVSALLRGLVTDFGQDPVAVDFFLGPSDGGTNAAAWAQTLPVAGAHTGAFARLVAGLLPETTYVLRARARNAAGEAWSDPAVTFTTPVYTPPTVVINEIHFVEDDPTVRSEFIELHNAGTNTLDLSGWFFDQGINHTLPSGTQLAPGGYLILCEDPATIQSKYGRSGPGVLSWQDAGATEYGSLRNSGERVSLRDAGGYLVDEVEYGLGFPWPTVGDVAVRSIELIHPSLDNNMAGHWRASVAAPTPGADNSVFAPAAPPALRQVDHAPVAPVPGQTYLRSGQEVRVTVKATDPNGVQALTLLYQVVEPGDYIKIDDPRFEAPASWISVPMNDAGAAGDLLAGDDVYSGLIPAAVQTHRRLIRYRITASNLPGLFVRVPYADDPQPNFAYFVHDGTPDWTASRRPGTEPEVVFPGSLLDSVPATHLITRVEEHSDSQYVPVVRADGTTRDPAAGAYGHSLYNWKGALCHHGRVYDHIRFRARGGGWRFAMGKNMWKFDFNRGHDFEARDNRGNRYDQAWKKMNFSSVIQQGDYLNRGEQGLFESVGFRLFQLTGLPAEHTQFTHFRIVSRPSETNGTASQFDDDFQGLYLAIEQQDGQFLDEHGLPDGNLYKMEGGTGELNNQGPTQPKDKSDLVAFQSYGATEAWWRANAELPQYYNYRAIVDCIHHYDIGDGKNYFYYHNPVTGKWMTLPWDLDLTWADNMYRADAGIAGLAPSGNPTEPYFSRVFGNGSTTGIPALQMEHRNRVREVLDLLFTPEQVGMLIDEMASFIWQPGQASFVDADRAMWDYNPILVSTFVNASKAGHGRYYQSAVDNPATPASEVGTFAGMIQKMKNYITTRRGVVTAQILTPAEEGLVPTTPVAARVDGGAGSVPANALTFSTSAFAGQNGAVFAALKWRIAEVTDPAAPGFLPYDRLSPRLYEADPETSWESPEISAFAPTFTFPPVTARVGVPHRVRVKHKDNTGRWSHWSAPVALTVGPADVGVYVDGLVVSQFLYNPADPSPAEQVIAQDNDSFEWLELMNVGAAPLDLAPVRLTRGVDFDFANSAVTNLAPGARVTVVKNLDAFRARYGNGPVVAGEWDSADNLANGGEEIRLAFGTGTVIREFTYDDDLPWPVEGDAGHALVLVHPSSRPDHALAANWRASLVPQGAPGLGDATSFAAWSATHGVSDPEGDEDADGLLNLAEYALGGLPAADSRAALPRGSVEDYAGADHFTLTFRRNLAADDVRVWVEISDEVTPWVHDPGRVVWVGETRHPDGTATVVYRSAHPLDGKTREFFRLKLEQR